MDRKKKVFIGLSGGVDSSVSAALLKKATPNNFSKLFGRPTPKDFKGYDVTGVFIKVWQPDLLECTWKEDRRDAMRVCAQLDIPFETLDLEKEYKEGVVDYMVAEYKVGRTPNPDVMCNRQVKFGAFLSYARECGADFIATGHYAQNVFNADSNKYELLAGEDGEKDQSYFLWTLTQEDLRSILFPVGHLQKTQVRALAEKFDLPTALKKDSQGLCFMGKLDMKEFLSNFLSRKEGALVDNKGRKIGTHDGALFYTLGQRHGFTAASSVPQYVVAKDMDANTVTVAPEPMIKAIGGTFKLKETNWITATPNPTKEYSARNRYRQELFPCRIIASEHEAIVTFTDATTFAPPGQSFVAFQKRGAGFLCMGGGVIA